MSRRIHFEEDQNAQVGIGTMIVFIATVLVAAIAAGVLITTSSDLQEKASRTGQEATEQVASNLAVQNVVGYRSSSSGNLEELWVYLTLSPGAANVDIGQLKVQITDGDSLATLDYATGGGAPGAAFTAVEERDVDNSFDATSGPAVLTSGDLIYIKIDPGDGAVLGADIPERKPISLSLIPEVGNSVPVGFITPNSFGTALYVDLA